MAKDARPGLRSDAHRTPDRFPFRSRLIVERKARAQTRQPIEEKVAGCPESEIIVGEQWPFSAVTFQRDRWRGGVQDAQSVGGGGIERTLVLPRLDQARVKIIAQILQNGEAGCRIGPKNRGR